MNKTKTIDSEKFFRVYAGLVDGMRDEIVVVVNKEPYTWRVCYFEMKQKTELGEKMLDYLIKLELI